MTPDKKAAVLADYRAKKATSAAALARAHGLSRSAVYRLLQSVKVTSDIDKPRGVAVKAKTEEADSVIFNSDDEQDFQKRSERFAEDLGLPSASNLKNFDDGREGENNADERLDKAAEAMFGSFDAKPEMPDDVLESVFNGPPPSQAVSPRRTAHVVIPYEESPVVKHDLIQRIIFNVENFGPLLNTIVGPSPQAFIASLQSLRSEELEKTLEVIERTRSVGNIAAGLKQTFFMVASATEVGASVIGVKARGFADRLRAEDQQITMIMKELAIENWARVKGMDSPTARLGVLFCMTLAQTDSMNRLNDVMRPQMAARQIPEAFVKANSDL